MKPYLVDIPVAIQAFVRPALLEKQWAVIKEARPNVLFIRSDGPRQDISGEKEKIAQSRIITEDVDWECKVHRLYFEKNQGMYTMSKQCDDYIWSHAERCLYLEDDILPAVSAFRFCAELLEKYKDDLRIGRIVLSLWREKYDTGDGDYFFAKSAAASGVAMWKRSVEYRNCLTCFAQNEYAMKSIKSCVPKYLQQQFYAYAKNGTYQGHIPLSEFNNRFNEYFFSQLNILPCRTMVSNLGVGIGSAHSREKSENPEPQAAQIVFSKNIRDGFSDKASTVCC